MIGPSSFFFRPPASDLPASAPGPGPRPPWAPGPPARDFYPRARLYRASCPTQLWPPHSSFSLAGLGVAAESAAPSNAFPLHVGDSPASTLPFTSPEILSGVVLEHLLVCDKTELSRFVCEFSTSSACFSCPSSGVCLGRPCASSSRLHPFERTACLAEIVIFLFLARAKIPWRSRAECRFAIYVETWDLDHAGMPRGAGGMSVSWNFPIVLLSRAKIGRLAPAATMDFHARLIVPTPSKRFSDLRRSEWSYCRSMSFVNTPPSVSDTERQTASPSPANSNIFSTSPLRPRPPLDAGRPMATTFRPGSRPGCGGFCPTSLMKRSSTHARAWRVMPPTQHGAQSRSWFASIFRGPFKQFLPTGPNGALETNQSQSLLHLRPG